MNLAGKTKIVTTIVAIMLILALGTYVIVAFEATADRERRIGVAIEFMNHAAAAYIAQDKGWYEEQGLRLSGYKSYMTGMALAAALAQRDIQVAYVCLVPAINAYANAGIPIKIVAGTHRYGYALVANPKNVTEVQDLAKPGLRIGCVREGGAVDVLLNRTIEKYDLDRNEVLRKVRRMNPPKQLLAIRARQLDAAFLPEQWATMAEDLGFDMIVSAQDVWPRMQGSVLVVKEELIQNHPELVSKLVAVTRTATDWINRYPEESAKGMARQLSVTGKEVIPLEAARFASRLEISPETLLRSMKRLDYSTDISMEDVQEMIDYAACLGYIKKTVRAEELVDTRFLK